MYKLELNTKSFILDKINDFRNKVAYGEYKNNLRMDQASNMRLMVRIFKFSHDVRVYWCFLFKFIQNINIELGRRFKPYCRASCNKTTITRI